MSDSAPAPTVITLGEEDAGERIDRVLARRCPEFSRSALQRWIEQGRVEQGGEVVSRKTKAQADAEVAIHPAPPEQMSAKPQAIPLEILFEDEHLIVLDKQAGLVVHPAPGHPEGTLVNALLHHAEVAGGPDPLRPGIVHRLDKDTSGIMVVARSERAHTSLVRQLQSRKMSRIYRAFALGDIISGGTVDAPIGRHPVDRKRMAVVASGRPAVSHYRIVERFRGVTCVEVSLESGRTHQIRVHMTHIGHPLVGDPVYGRSTRRRRGMPDAVYELLRAFPRQALHAVRIELVHPGNGETAAFSAPLPPDLERLLAELRRLALVKDEG